MECFSRPILRDNILGATLSQLWQHLRDAIIFAVRAGEQGYISDHNELYLLQINNVMSAHDSLFQHTQEIPRSTHSFGSQCMLFESYKAGLLSICDRNNLRCGLRPPGACIQQCDHTDISRQPLGVCRRRAEGEPVNLQS